MATDFLMPKLGLTMEEGTILEWLVDQGAVVEAGTAVLLIETDKVETEVEATGGGRLHRLADAGETFACGEVIGHLLAEGEDPPVRAAAATTRTAAPRPTESAQPETGRAAPTAPAAPASGGRLMASPNARRVAAELGVDLRAVRGTGPAGRIVSEDVLEAEPAAGGSPRLASLAARRLADLLGVDINSVPVDPRDGRVTKEGVAAHVRMLLSAGAAQPPQATPAPAPPPRYPLTQEPSETIPLRGVRGTIAKRMHESLRETAQLSLFMDADLDAVVADRDGRKQSGTAPGYTDYVIAAVARSLKAHPVVNSQVTDGGIAVLPDIHVGMAVAIDSGLIVPVIRHAERLDLTELASETSRLAEAARDGNLTIEELEGGTFSVSTLGMYGVDGFTPVINPPNAAILGVGRIRDDVELSDGVPITKKRLTLSLTWDHRVLDGAPAGAFCREIVRLLADPAALDTPG